MKRILVLICFSLVLWSHAQTSSSRIMTKEVFIESDTTRLDTLSLYPDHFKAFYSDGNAVDQEHFKIDFARALFIRNEDGIPYGTNLRVEYQTLPSFLTRTYRAFDPEVIVPKATGEGVVYSSASRKQKGSQRPFEGLTTRGSLSRGVTIGSNQDAVVNSNFNLQIEGRLSPKVGIRASITDNEIPLQSGGFTQRLDEFDQVFIELFSDKWALRAGDLDLINTGSHFMRFQKKVSGVSVQVTPGSEKQETEIFASGALVRGKFHSHKFTGQDGNQGPYRIFGPENQDFVIMISGSERVYANGVLLRRGENFDYTIDYNTAEITFTSLYTVSSNIRFTVEYQLSERNYTRFMTFDGVGFKKENWNASIRYFNESDAKNSSLDQDLTDEQKEILAEAGNDQSKMIAPSAVPAEYDENRVLYIKTDLSGKEIYVYSNDPEAELYQVSFSYVGENRGDYVIETTLAAGRVYAYVDEIAGVKQGAYLPVVQLVAPERYQMINLSGGFTPGERTDLSAELSFSEHDQNLFSSIDNDQNTGYAAKILLDQRIIDAKWKLDALVDLEYLSENFSTIERIRNVEFARDWNVDPITAGVGQKQQLLKGGLIFSRDSLGRLRYDYEDLRIGEDYGGFRHSVMGSVDRNGLHAVLDGSVTRNEDGIEENGFDRFYGGITKSLKKFWIGAKYSYEKNLRKNLLTDRIDRFSHRFSEIEGFGGYGDSTRIFVELGYNYRKNDSLVSGELGEVDRSNTYFLKSRLLKSANSDLSLFVNYREVERVSTEDEAAVNGRLNYRQRIFKEFIQFQTLLETRSGNLPQQEFTYVEVEPGKGFYEWIDFNDNGVQELDEFVIARFPDKAIYVRTLLPSVSYLRTDQNKWSQSLQLNGGGWKDRSGLLKFLSHFNNHTYLLIDSKTRREGSDFQVSPFGYDEEDLLGLDQNLKNSLFYNRGLQRFSFVYTYLNARKKTIYTFGDQDLNTLSHQLLFIHKLGSFWLLEAEAGTGNSTSESQAFSNRNYDLETYSLRPRFSYLYNPNTRLEVQYTYKDKNNRLGDMETLVLHNVGANFRYADKQKLAMNANVNLIYNEFEGDSNSPVAYQMLEGLQPGTNYTWGLGVQKRLTSFLDLNLNYLGRKSEAAKAIHTGTMQLRASF